MLAEPRFVPRRSVFVQRALLNCFVEGGNGLSIRLLRRGFVAFCDAFAQVAQLRAQARGVGSVACGAAFGLTGALERRLMIRHVCFVTFVCTERYSG